MWAVSSAKQPHHAPRARSPVHGESRIHSHILEDESLWPQLAHGADGLGKHVALIHVAFMLAAHRKRLAWRTARDDHHVAAQFSVVEPAYVDLMKRPLLDMARVVALVLSERLASVGIPLNDCGMVKPGIRHADGHSASTRE
jgi:hypothetical protein